MAPAFRFTVVALAFCAALPVALAQGPGPAGGTAPGMGPGPGTGMGPAAGASGPSVMHMGPGGRQHGHYAGMDMLTPDERADFCRRMHASQTPAERQQIGTQMRELMHARAQERGVSLSGHHSAVMDCQPHATAPVRAAPTASGTAASTDGVPPVRRAGDIDYQTGGVGVDEVAAMRRTASEFNLRLTFTGHAGEALAGVNTSILSAKGQEVFAAVSDGPLLYVKMPPGTYRVVVTANGVERKASVTVPKRGGVTRSFNWPS